MGLHCQMIQAGEIQAIVGDASREGIGGRQYCGLWSLTSQKRQFNAFGNSYAGLLPGEIRGKEPVLECLDDTTCALTRKANTRYPTDVRAVYTVKAPYYIDHSLTLCDYEDRRNQGGFREVSWCCYMNCPEDPRLHFLSQGEWFRYISPEHGVGSNIAPAYVPDEDLEVWPEVEGKRPFHWDRLDRRFDEPFYCGRLGNMVLILIFGQPEWLRFFCSPSGGGSSLLPGRTCPAWDFEWVIPGAAYEVGREYTFDLQLVYKEFASDEDAVAEYHRAKAAVEDR